VKWGGDRGLPELKAPPSSIPSPHMYGSEKLKRTRGIAGITKYPFWSYKSKYSNKTVNDFNRAPIIKTIAVFKKCKLKSHLFF